MHSACTPSGREQMCLSFWVQTNVSFGINILLEHLREIPLVNMYGPLAKEDNETAVKRDLQSF